MKQEQVKATRQVTQPDQVWATLSLKQQEMVLQTITQICHYLASQWEKEARNESDKD